jgi:hypothetical protein
VSTSLPAIAPSEKPLWQQDLPPVNFLEMIFEGQRHLMAKYHAIEAANGSPVIRHEEEGELDLRVVQDRLRQLFGFAIQEWGEAMQELKNKPWKRTDTPTDRAALYNEIGDVFHFFVEFCITAGMGPDDLHRAYFRMHQKNVQRQASNY